MYCRGRAQPLTSANNRLCRNIQLILPNHVGNRLGFDLETPGCLSSTKPSATLSTNRNAKITGEPTQDNAVYGAGRDARSVLKRSRLKEAPGILHVMGERGFLLESNAYGSLLQRCAIMKALPEGKLVHGHIIHKGFNGDVFLETKLVIMYSKCGSLADACRVLDEMPERNVVSWTAMISAYSGRGRSEEALALFYQMQQDGIRPNEFTFASILPACANLAALERGKEVHEDIIRTGFQSDVFVGNALIDMYAKCGSIENALKVFDKMFTRDMVSWSAMIAGYAQNGRVDEARKVFEKMPERNVVSWNVMIGGCAQNRYVDEALKLFMKTPERNMVSWNTMMAGYAQNGHVDKAVELFQKMSERDVVSWNAMIAGYAQNGHVNEAMELFRQMQRTGVKPNSVTFTTILPACANLSALEQGKEIHEEIIRRGFQSDVFLGSALVDMYAKCGSIENARQVFDKMPERNVVSWTAMIVGYAMHGYGKEAFQLFEQMQHSGRKPNHITFIGILSACCHAGLVDDGWQYFDCMSREFNITPTLEHYCCMVDLLGRAGQLYEAHDFINKMPINPDAAVWVSLLGACTIHNNIELGECAAERLFQLDPKNSTPYVLLSNIYAAAGRWSDREKVRNLMNDREVKKAPGCSWIEVNNKVHTFFIGDRSHPQMQEIYAKLEGLSGQMKEAGYVSNPNSVLHDVEQQQKEPIICHHSKNLAMAFGIYQHIPQDIYLGCRESSSMWWLSPCHQDHLQYCNSHQDHLQYCYM